MSLKQATKLSLLSLLLFLNKGYAQQLTYTKCPDYSINLTDDIKFTRLYLKGLSSLNERQESRANNFFLKAKTRAEKLISKQELNIPTLRSLFTLYSASGNLSDAIYIGRLLVCSKTIDVDILKKCINFSWELKDNTSALFFFRNSQKLFGNNYQTTNAIRNIFLQLGEADSALAVVENHIKEKGSELKVNEIKLALLYVNTLNKIGRELESYLTLKGLLREFPAALPIKISFIYASQALGKEDTAKVYFKRLIENTDITIDVKTSIVINRIKRLSGAPSTHKGWRSIAEWANWNIEANLSEPKAYAVAAEIAVQQKKWLKARSLWKKAINLPGGDLWELRQGIILADEKLDSIKWMLNDAQEASVSHSNHPLFSLMLSNAQYKNENYEAARNELNAGVSKLLELNTIPEKKSRLIDYYFALGNVSYKLGDEIEMSRCFDTVLSWAPNDALTLNNYSYFLAKNKSRLYEALNMIEKVNKEFPSDAIFLDTYAYVLLKIGNYSRAETIIKSCLNNGGSRNPITCIHAAAIFKQTGNKDLYDLYYRLAIDLGKNQNEIHKEMIE